MKFKFFQQLKPIKLDPKGDNESPHRIRMIEVKPEVREHLDAEAAIRNAKAWTVYRTGRGLGKHPIVQEIAA